VFAAFGPGGAGSCPVSSVAGVAAAAAAGVQVRWWAGGGPSVPLRARLARRSAALVSSASAVVAFLASPAPGGSVGALSLAASRGLPAFACACGFSPALLPPLGAGSWVAVASGPLAGAFRWVPAATQLSLLPS